MKRLRRQPRRPMPAAREGHWNEVRELFAAINGPRPHYTWSVSHAALVARRLAAPAISVLELGVAGGRGLLALEDAAAAVGQAVGVQIEVHGFDSGEGLPAPLDWRDAPYLIGAGDFAMDVDELRDRLRNAQLHLGPVAETIRKFLDDGHPPVAFAAFDLDYYSSTRDALALALGPPERLMPRFLAYFDDVLGYPWGSLNGPRPAIAEFNQANGRTRVVDELRGLRYMVPASELHARWTEAMFLVHVLDHPRYAEPEDTALVRQLEL